MDEPDVLYTLRAQYWLGHYALSLSEAKDLKKLPLNRELKIEREEFTLRSLLSLKQYDKVMKNTTESKNSIGIHVLGLRARYESTKSRKEKMSIIESVKNLLKDNSNSHNTTLAITASHMFLSHGEMTRDALKCVQNSTHVEHLALSLQIYLQINRLDLAKNVLKILCDTDEDAVLTQLSAVQVYLFIGRSQTDDALHRLNSLLEQYGPSPMLLNYMVVAYMVLEKYDAAENIVKEVTLLETDSGKIVSVDTLINTLACYQYLGKRPEDISDIVNKLKEYYPDHSFVNRLKQFETAFERESEKYKVKDSI